jgi:hypothetical protein
MWTKKQIAKFVDEQPDNAAGDEILRKLFMTIAIERGMDKGTRKQAFRDYEKAQFEGYSLYEDGYPVELMPEYIAKSAFLDAATTSPEFIHELTGEQIYSTDGGRSFTIVDVFASYVAMMCHRYGLDSKQITGVFNRLRHVGWRGVTNNLKKGQTFMILREDQAEFMHEDGTFKKMRALKRRSYPCICLDLLDLFFMFQGRLQLIPECQRNINSQEKASDG